jgi:DNA-binding transcriptional ArsR family regulator
MAHMQSKRPRAIRPAVITDLAQIRGLASPVRQEIIDAVTAIGPVSIAALARSLGRAPNALYFHIQKLEGLGLLVRCEEAAIGKRQPSRSRATGVATRRGRPSTTYDVPGRPMMLAYQPRQSRTKAPMAKLIRSMLSSAGRSFVRSYRPDVAVVDGLDRNLWASRSKRMLSPRELRQVNRHLRGLVALLNKPRPEPTARGQLMELTFVLAPSPGKHS